MNRRLILHSPLPLAAILLFGCAHGQKKAAGLNPAKAEAVKANAQKSFEEVYAREGGHTIAIPKISTAAAAASPVKVIGKDKALPCIWVESPAQAFVDANTSPAQARAIAVSKAEAAAMEAPFIHETIKERDMVFKESGLRDNPTMVETLLEATRPGRIIKEETLSEEHHDLAQPIGYYVYSLDMKLCLVPTSSQSDQNFGVEMWISRPDETEKGAESAKHFVSGAPVRISITCSENCYVYLYDLYDEVKDGRAVHQIIPIVPNAQIPALTEVRLQGGHTWVYPNDELAANYGVELKAQLPEGKSESTEAIWALASKRPLPDNITRPSEDGQSGILRKLFLSRLPLTWADDSQGYVIYGN